MKNICTMALAPALTIPTQWTHSDDVQDADQGEHDPGEHDPAVAPWASEGEVFASHVAVHGVRGRLLAVPSPGLR